MGAGGPATLVTSDALLVKPSSHAALCPVGVRASGRDGMALQAGRSRSVFAAFSRLFPPDARRAATRPRLRDPARPRRGSSGGSSSKMFTASRRASLCSGAGPSNAAGKLLQPRIPVSVRSAPSRSSTVWRPLPSGSARYGFARRRRPSPGGQGGCRERRRSIVRVRPRSSCARPPNRITRRQAVGAEEQVRPARRRKHRRVVGTRRIRLPGVCVEHARSKRDVIAIVHLAADGVMVGHDRRQAATVRQVRMRSRNFAASAVSSEGASVRGLAGDMTSVMSQKLCPGFGAPSAS